MTVTMESAVFMGKNSLNNCQSIASTKDHTLRQMFDISTRLVSSEQEEISGLETIGRENHSWKYLSLIGDERIINLQRAKVYVFSDSVLCLGRVLQHPESNEAWKNRVAGIRSVKSYRARNEQANFEKGVANFRNASKAECACVKHTWLFFQISDPEQGYFGPGLELVALVPVVCFTEIPKPSCSHSLAFLQISMVQKLYLECTFSVALKRALLGIYVFSKQLRKFAGRPWLSTTRAS